MSNKYKIRHDDLIEGCRVLVLDKQRVQPVEKVLEDSNMLAMVGWPIRVLARICLSKRPIVQAWVNMGVKNGWRFSPPASA